MAAEGRDAITIADALEALIADGRDRPEDRQRAFDAVRELSPSTAADALARAIVTGRLVQSRGLAEAERVRDIERWAMKSRALDPHLRDDAASRLLGTLWVLAPGPLLEHGDSEQGLSLLVDLAGRRPDVLANHLRLGEAFVALGDPEPAAPHLCRCQAEASKLRPDERALLAQLMADGGTRCPAPAPASPSAPPTAPPAAP